MIYPALKFGKSFIGKRLFLVLLCLLSFVLPFRPVGGYSLLLAWSICVFLCLLFLKNSLHRGSCNKQFMGNPAVFSLLVFTVIQLAGVFASWLPFSFALSFAGYRPNLYQISLILSSSLFFGSGFVLPGLAREASLLSPEGLKIFCWVKVIIQVLLCCFVMVTSFHIAEYSYLNYSSLRPVAGLLMISILSLLLFDYYFYGSLKSSLIVLFSVVAGELVLTSAVPGFESFISFVAIFCWAFSSRFRLSPKFLHLISMRYKKLSLPSVINTKTFILSGRYVVFAFIILIASCFTLSSTLRSSVAFVAVKYTAIALDPLGYQRLSSISSVSKYLSDSGLVFGSVTNSWNHLLSHNSFLDIAVRQGFLPAVALLVFYLFAFQQALREVSKCGLFPSLVVLTIFLYANIQPFLVSDGYGVIVSFFALGVACSPFCGRNHQELV